MRAEIQRMSWLCSERRSLIEKAHSESKPEWRGLFIPMAWEGEGTRHDTRMAKGKSGSWEMWGNSAIWEFSFMRFNIFGSHLLNIFSASSGSATFLIDFYSGHSREGRESVVLEREMWPWQLILPKPEWDGQWNHIRNNETRKWCENGRVELREFVSSQGLLRVVKGVCENWALQFPPKQFRAYKLHQTLWNWPFIFFRVVAPYWWWYIQQTLWMDGALSAILWMQMVSTPQSLSWENRWYRWHWPVFFCSVEYLRFRGQGHRSYSFVGINVMK